MSSTPTVASHFTKSTAPVRATYDAVLAAARSLGPVREEPKKTSLATPTDVDAELRAWLQQAYELA